MYLSLYRRHRPGVFSEVVAQEAAVNLLRREIASGKNSHAYLFSGPRGCGKTTLARIVAKALNCTDRDDEGEPCAKCLNCLSVASGENLDVIEIDGASNRGIDEIRELKEHISLSPFSGRFKVYIIDEVHMLTEAAFNALLKTLEEPPQTVVFILATTEPHKVPATIRSRCQHIPFHRIPLPAIVETIKKVSATEGVAVEEEALWEIARESDGSLRDALSLLEQAVTTGLPSVSLEEVRGILGGGGRSDLERLVPALRDRNPEAFRGLLELIQRGLAAERLLEGLFLLFRDILVAVLWKEEGIDALPLSEEDKSFVRDESRYWSESDLWKVLDFCSATLPRARYGLKGEVLLGMLLGLFLTPRAKDEPIERIKEEPLPEKAPPMKEEAVSETGKTDREPPSPGEDETPLEPSPPVPDAVKGDWRKCVDGMAADNLPLYCACVSTSFKQDGESMVVIFPEDRCSSFELATSPRNLAYLDSIRLVQYSGVPMELACGERTVQVDGVPQGEKDSRPGEAEEVPPLFSAPQGPQGAPAELSPRSYGSDPGGVRTEEGRQNGLLEIQKTFNADLLVLKEENADGLEDAEGEAAE
jgi:DNA polymerase-3 subunit gamma/tau